MKSPDLFPLQSGAEISECGRYRYRLHRQLQPAFDRTCLFAMLNPSTADGLEDDNTIRRCIRFARDWGYDRLVVVNLFAWRATDPSELGRVDDPIGPENDDWLAREARAAQLIVCAWGKPGELHQRAATVIDTVLAGHTLHALKLNADGSPRHPLYVRSSTQPTVWRRP